MHFHKLVNVYAWYASANGRGCGGEEFACIKPNFYYNTLLMQTSLSMT